MLFKQQWNAGRHGIDREALAAAERAFEGEPVAPVVVEDPTPDQIEEAAAEAEAEASAEANAAADAATAEAEATVEAETPKQDIFDLFDEEVSLHEVTAHHSSSDSRAAVAEAAEAEVVAAAPVEASYTTILDQATFDSWLKKLNDAKLFAFDTETTGIDAQKAQLVGVSFAVQPHEAAYIPLTHSYVGAPEQLDRDTVLLALKPLLEDPTKLKVGQPGRRESMSKLW